MKAESCRPHLGTMWTYGAKQHLEIDVSVSIEMLAAIASVSLCVCTVHYLDSVKMLLACGRSCTSTSVAAALAAGEIVPGQAQP